MVLGTVVEESSRVVSAVSTDYYDAPMTPLSKEVEVSPDDLVVGTTTLYENDSIRFVPMPTPSPKDPLNLPKWRKIAAVGALSLFGALAMSVQPFSLHVYLSVLYHNILDCIEAGICSIADD